MSEEIHLMGGKKPLSLVTAIQEIPSVRENEPQVNIIDTEQLERSSLKFKTPSLKIYFIKG